MGSNAPAPWTPTITIKTTDDAIKFFELLRDACNQRRIAWWMHDALQEFPSPEARVAAARALDKAMRIDLLMDQNLNVALAPQGGVRLNMDTADETPAREGTHHVPPLPRHHPVSRPYFRMERTASTP